MKVLMILVAALLLVGCGEERADELGPYVQEMKKLEKYGAQLLEYEGYLGNEATVEKGKNLPAVLDALYDDIYGMPIPDDKKLKAVHNSLRRTLETNKKKIGSTDSITYVLSARKRINSTKEAILKLVNNLKKIWEEDERTDFPINLPFKA